MMVFTIPATGGKEENEEMNRYLRGSRVVSVEKQFYQQSNAAYWSFCVTVADNTPPSAANFPAYRNERHGKIDYREVLDDKAFALFCRLRVARKAISTERGVPAYTIFTDAELAEMTKTENLDITSISKISGIGPRRAEKFGGEILQRLQAEMAETNSEI